MNNYLKNASYYLLKMFQNDYGMPYQWAHKHAVGYVDEEGGEFKAGRPSHTPPILILPDGRIFDMLLRKRGLSPIRRFQNRIDQQQCFDILERQVGEREDRFITENR